MYYNFKSEDYNYYCDEAFNKVFTDKRNGFEVKRPTMDMRCYLNYLQLLNSMRNKWVNFGYMDIGLIPLLIAPSFMQHTYLPNVISVCSNNNIPYIILPAVSFMRSRCEKVSDDLWIKRRFVMDYCGCSTMYSASTIQFIEEVFKDVIQ